MLVAASGDWTKDTLTVEGPSIANIYKLLDHPDRFNYVRFEFDHNYNQTSREAVYGWFGKWLLKAQEPDSIKEKPFKKEPDADLRVFSGNQLPDGALSLPQFLQSLRELHRRQWQGLVPADPSGLALFQKVFLPAWRHTLQVDSPSVQPQVHSEQARTRGDLTAMPVTINRAGNETGIAATYWSPSGILSAASPRLLVLVSPDPLAVSPTSSVPPEQVLPFLEKGLAVLIVDKFSSGHTPDPFTDFYPTYNRTEIQSHVNDLLTICAAASSIDPRKKLAFQVTLAGAGRAGLWTLLAAPAADAVIADCDSFDVSDESALLASDLYCPGILALGGFEGVAMLAAPHPLLLHNIGSKFSTTSLHAAYDASGVQGRMRIASGHLTQAALADWAAKL
jgi:hypothetical protein